MLVTTNSIILTLRDNKEHRELGGHIDQRELC